MSIPGMSSAGSVRSMATLRQQQPKALGFDDDAASTSFDLLGSPPAAGYEEEEEEPVDTLDLGMIMGGVQPGRSLRHVLGNA